MRSTGTAERPAARDYKDRVRGVFDGSAEAYADGREQEPGFRRQAEWLAGQADPERGRRVLEVGCGPGSLSDQLARRGFVHVGMDLSMEMIRRFSARAGRLGGTCRAACADAEALPFRDDSFDHVIAIGLLEYLPAPERFFREAHRVLAERGTLLLSVPSSFSPYHFGTAAFDSLPHRLRARLLGKDPSQPIEVVRSRPVRLGRLARDLRVHGFRPRRWRFTHFVFFPLDRLAPGLSDALAGLLEPLGGVPGISRLGAQILLAASRTGEEAA